MISVKIPIYKNGELSHYHEARAFLPIVPDSHLYDKPVISLADDVYLQDQIIKIVENYSAKDIENSYTTDFDKVELTLISLFTANTLEEIMSPQNKTNNEQNEI